MFWERVWEIINAVTYRKHVSPHVANFISINPTLQFIQDNIPPYKAHITSEALRVRKLLNHKMAFFAKSQSESIWCEVKTFIATKYVDLEEGKERSYEGLRRTVPEA